MVEEAGSSEAEELTEAQRAALRQRLESLRDELRANIEGSLEQVKPVDLDQPIGRISRVDAIQQQKLAQANQRRARLRLEQVQAALAQLGRGEEGGYGFCNRCEEAIGWKRLQARPEAPVCAVCQEDMEAARRGRR